MVPKLLKSQAASLLRQYGIRGVCNALAEVIQESAMSEKPLPYDTSDEHDYPVDLSDMEQAAHILKEQLW